MVKEDLVKRSPLRALERSIHGGLGPGHIGVLASRKGVGKTACLVHIAADRLLQGRPVIHVSYSARVDYIINWYEDIFKEITGRRESPEAAEFLEEVIRHRVIMNFKQDGARTEQVLKSIEAMIKDGRFEAQTLIVDGYDFGLARPEDLSKFREFAGRLGIEFWFSASLRGEDPLYDDAGVPRLLAPFLGEVSVLITLHDEGGHVRLKLVKDRDFPPGELNLKLDPRTLLLAEA
ncbi:MAG: hypothetical protein FJY83_00615 [Candidatus Aminicenantes bacterium]|nr:hypothetical protein [Candidatus Aminicenantes bacterium]